MIKVLIAEDQALVLGALAALLRLEDDIEVVGMARNGHCWHGTCRPELGRTILKRHRKAGEMQN